MKRRFSVVIQNAIAKHDGEQRSRQRHQSDDDAQREASAEAVRDAGSDGSGGGEAVASGDRYSNEYADDAVDGERYSAFAGRLERVCREAERRSILHVGVLRGNDTAESKQIIEQVCSRGKNLAVKFVTWHDDHIHVVHTCPWSGSQCKCFGITPKRARNRSYSSSSITIGDWKKLLQYYLQEGRTTVQLKIGNDYTKPAVPFRMEDIRHERGAAQHACGSAVEICGTEREVLLPRDRIGTYGDDEGDPNGNGERGMSYRQSEIAEQEAVAASGSAVGRGSSRDVGRRRITRTDQETEACINMLWLICCSPITDGNRTLHWKTTNLKYISDRKLPFIEARNHVRTLTSLWKISDFINFYDKREEANLPCLWSARSASEFDSLYFDVRTSVKKALQLLIWQYSPSSMDENYRVIDHQWKINVYKYLKSLISLLNQTVGKTNSHYYLSGPCSGKTFFFDAIKDFFLNTGNMTNFNKNCQFPMQMCVDVRVIFWNEPNIEPSAVEDLKKILGGEYYTANVKCKDHQVIKPTPVIITGNFPCIFDRKDMALNHRIKYYTWRKAPFLEHNGAKRLHPLCIKNLITLCSNYFEEELHK